MKTVYADDLAVNQIITIGSCSGSVLIPSNDGPILVSKNTIIGELKGEPLIVSVIDLPFILCLQYNKHIDKWLTISLDTREYGFLAPSIDYCSMYWGKEIILKLKSIQEKKENNG
jgi:hypothetical protein